MEAENLSTKFIAKASQKTEIYSAFFYLQSLKDPFWSHWSQYKQREMNLEYNI